jgi:hypothetical protein
MSRTLNLDFVNSPGFLDPRAAFVRASAARFEDAGGTLRAAPANTPRWEFNSITGAPEGALIEPARTNLGLHSEDFTNAAHTKTGLTVTANTAVGPDGLTTMDTLAATAANGNIAQAVTITAGNAISASKFFRANASNFVSCTITDGANAVVCWFNLAAGTVGSNTAGATTVVFHHAIIRDYGGGLYRVGLTCTTATSTTFTVAWSPCAADGAAAASGNSVFAVGLGIEAPGTTSAVSSYIPTTSGSVTRSGDSLLVPVANVPYVGTEGAIILEWTGRRHHTGNVVYGGIGDSFANTAYLTRSGASTLFYTVISATGTSALIGLAGVDLDTEGAIIRTVLSWKADDMAFTVNGRTPITKTSAAPMPIGLVRYAIGGTPFFSPATSQAGVPMRRAALYSRKLSLVDMQTLTAV